jgi:hypothetical protein
MRRPDLPLFVLATLLAIGLTRALPQARAGQVACIDVIKRVNRHVSHERGISSDLSVVARDLGSTAPWVEHCMRVYGRRSRRPGLESAEGREERLEAFEDSEPEESGPEDAEEFGARERPEHPEQPRYRRFKLTPTPELGEQEQLQ